MIGLPSTLLSLVADLTGCRRPRSCPTRILKESLYLTQIPAIMILELPSRQVELPAADARQALTKAGSNYCVRRKYLLALVKGSCLSGICEEFSPLPAGANISHEN